MDDTTDTLTIPHDLYTRLAAYAASHGEAPETLVAAWLRERLGDAGAPQEEAAELQARLEAIASLDGILSAPVGRDWADQHDLAVAEAPMEDSSENGHSA